MKDIDLNQTTAKNNTQKQPYFGWCRTIGAYVNRDNDFSEPGFGSKELGISRDSGWRQHIQTVRWAISLVDFIYHAQIIKSHVIEDYRPQSQLHSDPKHALVVQFELWSAAPKPKTDQGHLTYHEDAIQKRD